MRRVRAGGSRGAAAAGKGAGHAKGPGYAKGAGPHSGAQQAAASSAAGAPPGRAAAGLRAVCAYDPEEGAVHEAPDLATDRPVIDCSACSGKAVLLTAEGMLYNDVVSTPIDCSRASGRPTRIQWPVAAVSLSPYLFVALRRGGAAVHCLDGRGQVSGADEIRGEVQGLPHGDPVTLLAAGGAAAIAVTRSDAAYGWGSLRCLYDGWVHESQCAVRLPQLCGRGLRRLACGYCFGVAETRGGQLLGFGGVPGLQDAPLQPLLPSAGRIAFPLRSLAAGSCAAAAADAAGQLWCLWRPERLHLAALPRKQIVVRAALGGGPESPFAVALTVEGRLWECKPGARCRSIGHSAPGRGTVLLPYGGIAAHRVVLVPDPSCGLARCRLLLLISGRRELLPGGEMRRIGLVPFLVHEDWVFEEQPEDGAAGGGSEAK
eukprot:TRINITY_DN22535_c0_g1_i4.p1 TRINITY_DN22535_c0_g1~~TRINITY_DN22535_c0_g1_i4.p1  ORF type:complete len:455 (+),score=95.24 TRINITY_DN22535_c0_g1_i4:73-1365(+)